MDIVARSRPTHVLVGHQRIHGTDYSQPNPTWNDEDECYVPLPPIVNGRVPPLFYLVLAGNPTGIYLTR